MEDYHTAVVHKASIGLQDTVCEVTNGAWDCSPYGKQRIHRGVARGNNTISPH